MTNPNRPHDTTPYDPTLGSPSSPDAAAAMTAPTLAAPLREGPGTKIGPYKLLQQIGEGGFGSVFMAEQTAPVQRKVALKIIKLGMDTRQVVARFEQERQALAMMDHPNIARVFDAGATETGRPFFVMELVKGDPIVEYCDKNNLSINDRLELFAQVCNAVQHAHTKGIIHRDIKPSNILVSTQDGRPNTKVIDFGIAKATANKLTEKTLFTEHRQLIGTPEYMSPEQAEGSLDIDTRTDIYSLGVLLYELLTGTTPFSSKELRSAAYAEIQRIIREVEPPNPSTRLSQNTATIAGVAAKRDTEPKKLGTAIRGELDWIVMRAMEKDRQRRYETANGLAMDIQRYLAGEAVVAAPPSTAYRMRKFIRRHKGSVTTGAAVAAALLIGVFAFAWQANVARAQRDLAIAAQQAEAEQRALADTQRDRAVAAEGETKKRAEELKDVSEFQAKMLSDIDPANAGIQLMRDVRGKFAAAVTKIGVPEADRPARIQSFERDLAGVNATDAAVDMIDRTILIPALAAVETKFKSQPAVDAALRHTLATLYKTLGNYDRAEELQRKALETQRRALGDDHEDTIVGISDLGTIREAQGKLPEAEALHREAMERSVRVLGRDHKQTQIALSNFGNFLRDRGRYAEAEPLLVEAVDTARRVRGMEDRNTLIQLNTLSYLRMEQGDVDEAEKLLNEAYETGKRVLGPDDPDVIVWTNNMGGIRASRGKHKESEPYYREALAAIKRVKGEEHPDVALMAFNVAASIRSQGRAADAEPTFRQALELRRRTLGEEHPDTLSSLEGLAGCLRDQGKLDEALAMQRRALDSRRRVQGNADRATISAMQGMARMLASASKDAEAEVFFREAIDTSAGAWGEENPDRLVLLVNYGNHLVKMGRVAEAEPILRRVYDARRKASGDDHPETLVAVSGLARLLQDEGKLDEAEPMLREVLARFRRVVGENHPDTISAITNHAGILALQKKPQEAEPLWRESVERALRVFGKDHARTGANRMNFGRTLTVQKQFTAAETELVDAERILSTAQGVSAGTKRRIVEALSDLYEAWAKAEPGKGHDAKAAEWKTKLDAMPPPAPPASAAAPRPAASPAPEKK